MPTHYEFLRIFVSSPGDVAEERGIAEEVIKEVSSTCRDTLGIALEVDRWEGYPPVTPILPEERIQDVLNERVANCHIFLLLLNKRYGSTEPGHSKSNTQREVEIAVERLEKYRKLTLLSYFRTLPENRDLGEQEQKVRALRAHLREKGIWFKEYSSPRVFRIQFTHDLYKTILRFRLSSSKHKALTCFWQLGITDQNPNPNLAIIYPPVDRKFMRQEDPDHFWRHRLLPHVVFEDFKAMQKLEKSLRLIGFRGFRFYNTRNIPSNYQDVNRVWLCLPRNPTGLQQLEVYKRNARFGFVPVSARSAAAILWRSRLEADSFFRVESPLEKYLLEQRKLDPGGDWNLAKGQIIARDFAVIGRFSDTSERAKGIMKEGTLKDYFIAGVRGLGTWGAGWFIDRRYDVFRHYDENEAIQMLLEVTYRNERILEVQDVSEKPKEYFQQQNTLREVRRTVEAYQERS